MSSTLLVDQCVLTSDELLQVEKLIQELPDFNLDEDEQFETILQTQVSCRRDYTHTRSLLLCLHDLLTLLVAGSNRGGKGSL